MSPPLFACAAAAACSDAGADVVRAVAVVAVAVFLPVLSSTTRTVIALTVLIVMTGPTTSTRSELFFKLTGVRLMCQLNPNNDQEYSRDELEWLSSPYYYS